MKIKHLLLLLSLAILNACSFDKCGFPTSDYFSKNIEKIITLENTTNFNVGDTLWVRTTINKSFEASDGSIHEVKVGTKNETSFIELKVWFSGSIYDLTGYIIPKIGHAYSTNESFIDYNFEDNKSKNQLESYFGIIFKEKGNYRISLGSDNTYSLFFSESYYSYPLKSYVSDQDCPDKTLIVRMAFSNASTIVSVN